MFKEMIGTTTAAISLLMAIALVNTASATSATSATSVTSAVSTKSATSSGVVEVVTFKLKEGVSAEEFKILDLEVKKIFIEKQAGYISRESAFDKNEWLVIVHWRNSKDAEASMKKFMTAASAQAFMAKLDATTMNMKRYIISK